MVTITYKNSDAQSELFGEISTLRLIFDGSDAELVESCSLNNMTVLKIQR